MAIRVAGLSVRGLELDHHRTQQDAPPSPTVTREPRHHHSRALSLELGRNRTFSVHLPAAYNPNTPHALVVSLHGFKGNALTQERITGLSEAGADSREGHRRGFGPGKNGNESIRAWQDALASMIQQVPFTQELLSHLSDNLCLDSNSFHASGKSNRGGFTNLLACTPQTANLFASLAPVSPLYAGANPTNCAPTPRTHLQLPRAIGSYRPLWRAGRGQGGLNEVCVFCLNNHVYYESDARDDPNATPNIIQFREAATTKAWPAAKVGGIVKLPSAIKLKNLTTTTLDMVRLCMLVPGNDTRKRGRSLLLESKRLSDGDIAEGLVGAW
ncbi:hypothetical protein C8F01DRAFT_1086582 [Mycena amicta]|nr:hypothetical protein C8F01DRAFT_1086582 [Mycena amicta]